jgi:hypothetical protein
MIDYIYVIDVEASPKIAKAIISYLRPLTEPDAYREVSLLLRFLDVE